jgi:formylglycine-generating enzyme
MLVGGVATLSILLASAAAFGKPRCPHDMTLVSETCVDRYEASVVEVLPDGREQALSPHEHPEAAKIKAVSKAGAIPQTHVSWHDAKAACTNAGKRLCKADEWVSACKGPSKTKYPYGDTHVASMCVDTGRTAPLAKFYSGADMYTSKAMNDPRLNQMPNTVEKTGAATSCTNAYGAHDMVGNVHEWADDGAFHGGYYLDTRINKEGCEYITTAHNREYYDYSIGFRCCADADSLSVEEVAEKKPAPPKPMPAREVDESFYAHVAQLVVGASFPWGSGSAAGAIPFVGVALPVTARDRTERFASR